MALGQMGKAVAIVAVLIVVGAIAFIASGSDIPIRSQSGGTAQTGDLTDTQPITQVGGQNFDGLLTVTWDARDSNDPALTYDGTTDFDVICYERLGDNGGANVRDWEVLGSGDDNTTDESTRINVRASSSLDDGVTEMWCEITPEVGGTGIYFDMAGTIKANGDRIDTCIYDDPNLDQTPDFVCRVRLLDISPTDPNNLPTMELRLKFMEEATSANLGVADSILDIGTGNVDNRIKWSINFVTTSSQNDAGAIALSQFVIAVNATEGDDTLYDVGGSQIEVPNGANVQRLKFTQLDDIPLTSKIQYKWNYDQTTGQRDVASANLIVVQKGGDPEVDIPVLFETRFGAITDALCIDLELEYVDSFNVFSNTNDSVELVADTTNADECEL